MVAWTYRCNYRASHHWKSDALGIQVDQFNSEILSESNKITYDYVEKLGDGITLETVGSRFDSFRQPGLIDVEDHYLKLLKQMFIKVVDIATCASAIRDNAVTENSTEFCRIPRSTWFCGIYKSEMWGTISYLSSSHSHPHSIPHTKYLVSELCSSDICPCNILSCDDLSATFCLATFSSINKPTGSVLDVSKVSIRFGFLLSGFASVSELTSVHTEFGAECNSASNDTIFY